jgi:hypothetical protein
MHFPRHWQIPLAVQALLLLLALQLQQQPVLLLAQWQARLLTSLPAAQATSQREIRVKSQVLLLLAKLQRKPGLLMHQRAQLQRQQCPAGGSTLAERVLCVRAASLDSLQAC